MAETTYEDLEITIRSLEDDRFTAEVTRSSSQSRPRITFPRPLEKELLEQLLEAIDRYVRKRQRRATGQAADDDDGDSNDTPIDLSPKSIGAKLYDAIFREDIAELLLRCRTTASAKGRSGLRLRLFFDFQDQEAAYLAAIPWECLRDPEDIRFLACDVETPVVRQLSNPNDTKSKDREPTELSGPLRILVVDAAPKGQDPLDFKSELDRMTEAVTPLMDSGAVELHHLPDASLETLRAALFTGGYHVLHFMGHGGFDVGSGMGAILLVGSDGKKDRIDGEMAGALLKAIPSLRLVVLNSCLSACHAGASTAPLFQGVASGIIQGTGISAVVANQYTISDKAAIAFSKTFYERLAAGALVEQAMSEARYLLFERNSPEWITPVLFLSAAEGKLFSGAQAKGPTQVRVVEPRHPSAIDRLRVGIVSIDGWRADIEEKSDVFLRLTQHFDPDSKDGRLIKEQAWWQEKVFPELRAFLLESIDERRPLHLDFAAHQSIAFAAGWILEAKSGLDVSVTQRTLGKPLDWHPNDDFEPGGPLWQEKDDVELAEGEADVALAVTISNPKVIEEVEHFIQHKSLGIGRLVDATIAEPGPKSIQGGQHALRLAQALVQRLRQRQIRQRGGKIHVFGPAPNAFWFYFGQLSRSLGPVVLYEYPFGYENSYGRYQRSVELPPPDEAGELPDDW